MCGGCGGHLTKPGRWTVCITGYAFAPVIILLSVWPLHTFVSKNLQIYRTLSHLCDICCVKRTTSWIHLHGIKLPVYLPDLTEKVLVNKFSNWCSNEPKTRLVYNYQTDFNVLGLRSTTLYWPGFHCFILYILYIYLVIGEKLWKCCFLITQNTLQPQVCSDTHPVPSHHGITASLQTFLHNSANIWQHEVWCILRDVRDRQTGCSFMLDWTVWKSQVNYV